MGRANNFDGLRLTGALLVLFSHMSALSGREEWRFVGDHSFGNLGVLIFFSISGYLVSTSWHADPNLARFLSRRFLRMAPALLVAMPVTYFVVMSLSLQGFPDNPRHDLNGSLWTIPLEVFCYLILAGVALVSQRAAIVFAAVIGAWWLMTGGQATTSYLGYFGLFFAMGALLKEYSALRSAPVMLGMLSAGLLCLALGQTMIGLALIVPQVSIYIGTGSWPVLNRAGRYGDLSYGVYIYAWPAQQIVVALHPDANYFTLVIYSLALVLPLAWLSWRYIEAPALRFKPRTQRAPIAAPVSG